MGSADQPRGPGPKGSPGPGSSPAGSAVPGSHPAGPAVPGSHPKAQVGPALHLDTLPGWWSPRLLVLVWLPILLIGALHYGTGSHHHWIHDILRRMYYLPIILAAFGRGLWGGLVAALVVSVTYFPHAFFLDHRHDPAPPVEKALEVVLYHAVGAVAGWLADQERQRRVQLRVALEEQRRLQTQLVRAGRLSALGEVVAGIAHEIKNPLHALQGTAEVVDPLIPKEAEERRLWDRHVAELARLGRVADQFLSFASPRPIAAGPLDLREVATRLEELVAARARQEDVRLELRLPSQAIVISGDRDQLAQVGLNLVVNGLHALSAQGGSRGQDNRGAQGELGVQDEKGAAGAPKAKMAQGDLMAQGSLTAQGSRSSRLWLEVGQGAQGEETMAYLRVGNNGPAIPEEALEHIFDPFYSGDDEGTGLGLSISARIMEQHSGLVEVANIQGGVVFTLWLPLEVG